MIEIQLIPSLNSWSMYLVYQFSVDTKRSTLIIGSKVSSWRKGA